MDTHATSTPEYEILGVTTRGAGGVAVRFQEILETFLLRNYVCCTMYFVLCTLDDGYVISSH